MRLSCMMSAVLALAWAGAADACCFFKCCNKGGDSTRKYEGVSAVLPYLKVVSVNGVPVPPVDVTAPIDSTRDFVIVFESSPPCKDPATMDISFGITGLTVKKTMKGFKAMTPTAGIACRYTITVPAGTLQPGKTYTMEASFPSTSSSTSPTATVPVTIHTAP